MTVDNNEEDEIKTDISRNEETEKKVNKTNLIRSKRIVYLRCFHFNTVFYLEAFVNSTIACQYKPELKFPITISEIH
jgi:hypothetical protein